MQRSFTSNLALCATLSLAQASRLLLQKEINGMDIGAYGIMTRSDGSEDQIEIVMDEPMLELRAPNTNITLAQTMQQTDKEHSCTFVMDRHKTTEAEDFYTIVNAPTTYLDAEFPTNDAHYFFDGGQNETGSGMVSHAGRDSWHRISDGGYFKETLSLFGEDYIRPEDIRQGEIGNCWFLSSITAMAEFPGLIESTFLNKEISQAGVYGVQMYALGVPVTVMVDDYLPLVGASGSRTRYSHVGGDGALWGPIMEKAFAKFHGNYARIVAGDPVAGISTMNGSPYERMWTSNTDADVVWETLSRHDLAKDLMQIGTACGGGRTKYGLVKCHAYALIGVETRNGDKLVQMRNPWGSEGFKGKYKDGSNDGNFYMTLDEFMSDIQYIGINYNTKDWHHSYFLALDDTEPNGAEGQWNFCGAECTRYTVRINSDQDQTVRVGAHTWRSRSYPETDECMDATYNVERAHSIYAADGRKVFTFWNDARWMDPIEIKAGTEMVFYIELDLGRKGLSPDWAVTAWGESSAVSITVDGKASSDSLPYVKQNHSKLPANEGQESGDDSDDDTGNDEKAAEAAKKAEDAAEEAKAAQTNASYIMQNVLMSSGNVIEQVQKTEAALLKAQLQMERAQKAYEDAIICCGLTAAEIALGEDSTLEQLAGYIKVARAAAEAAEKEYNNAKAEQKKAQDEKAILDEAYENVKVLAQITEDAMEIAEEQLSKIQKLPGDTPEQQDALTRAFNAYEAAKSAKAGTDEMLADAKILEEQAEWALGDIQKLVDAALKHAQDSTEYVNKIQELIDERENGDDDAKSCAEDVIELLDDAGMYQAMAINKKAEVDAAKESIVERASASSDIANVIEKQSDKAEQYLAAADSTDLPALEATLEKVKDLKNQAQLHQNSIEFEYNTAKTELNDKITYDKAEMESFVEDIKGVMDKAEKQLEGCEKYDDTAEQIEQYEKAKKAFDAIVKLYNDAVAALKAACESKDMASEVVGTMKTTNTNAKIDVSEIDQVIKQLKTLIKAAGGDDDDCDIVAKFHETALQHRSDAEENHETALQLEDAINGHVKMAAEHHKFVMEIKGFGVSTLEAAKQDKNDLDKLKEHLQNAKDHASFAGDALGQVKMAKDAAVQVKETAFKQLLQEVSDLSAETEDQMVAIEELEEALQHIKETFGEANMKRDEAIGSSERADESIAKAAETFAMAEGCKEEIEGFIGDIEKLIEANENGEDEMEDDEIAKAAAEAAEKAQQDGKEAMESSMKYSKAVAEEAVAIEEYMYISVDEVKIVFQNYELAIQNLTMAQNDYEDDLETLESIRVDIENLAEEAEYAKSSAEGLYEMTMEMKSLIGESLEVLPMYVQDAENAKKTAEAAYNIANQHKDTDTQLEALMIAEGAYAEAAQHCQEAHDLHHNAKDIASKADINIAAIAAYLESVDTTVDFEAILEDIDELIDEAGGDGSALVDWLEDEVNKDFPKKCNGKSVFQKTDADLNAIGFSHQCQNVKKMLYVEMRGLKGVKEWQDKIVATSHDYIERECSGRNLHKANGWQKCVWRLSLEDGQKFGVQLDGVDVGKFRIIKKLINAPQ